MRLAAVACLVLTVGGCASAPRPPVHSEAMSTYIVIDERGAETCYSRFQDDIPADRICVAGDFVRYTQHPADLADAPVVPAYVAALFANTAAIADIDHEDAIGAPLMVAASEPGTESR